MSRSFCSSEDTPITCSSRSAMSNVRVEWTTFMPRVLDLLRRSKAETRFDVEKWPIPAAHGESCQSKFSRSRPRHMRSSSASGAGLNRKYAPLRPMRIFLPVILETARCQLLPIQETVLVFQPLVDSKRPLRFRLLQPVYV
jgi:hypothetical protein